MIIKNFTPVFSEMQLDEGGVLGMDYLLSDLFGRV